MMTADSRFAHGYWQRRNGQSAGTRSQIITGPVSRVRKELKSRTCG
jgi:hypothetical protein